MSRMVLAAAHSTSAPARDAAASSTELSDEAVAIFDKLDDAVPMAFPAHLDSAVMSEAADQGVGEVLEAVIAA